jgi:hypothetical protein
MLSTQLGSLIYDVVLHPSGIHHSLTSRKKCGEKRTLERWPYHVNVAFPASKQGRWKYITQNAVPDVAAAAITVMVVGAAVTSLARMNKSTTIEPKQVSYTCVNSVDL